MREGASSRALSTLWRGEINPAHCAMMNRGALERGEKRGIIPQHATTNRNELWNGDRMSINDGKRVLQMEADAILGLIPRLNGRFAEAVDLCYACTGHVVVTGMGKSGNIGQKIAATLSSTGTPAFFLHPAEGIHGDLGMVSKRDVVIALSNSGETGELVRILQAIKRFNLKVIALTGGARSTLARWSDVVLDVAVPEEACPLGLAPTSSTTAALAMGDALAVAILQKRGFRKEDFASFHPGGTLGRTLLMTVDDAMHRGEDIPVVLETLPMREVVVEMTSKKLGMTTVVNGEGRLCGVITDGDLRRLIRRVDSEALFSLPASAVIHGSPRSVLRGTLATQAIHLMETHAITVLVVVDDAGKMEGVVHLHDLLRREIV
jgi:arabinose-5-phosphate isomerase